MDAVKELSKNRWGVSVGLTIPILNPPSFSELASLEHKKKALEEKTKYFKKQLELDKNALLYKKEKILKRFEIAKGIYDASEKTLKEVPFSFLSTSQKLELLDDYIQVIQSYQNILCEMLILDVSFEKKEGKK